MIDTPFNMIGKHITSVIGAIRSAVPGCDPLALHEPEFGGREWEYVKSCIDDGWVSSGGPFVVRFEEELARISGRSHAVACVNGTAALHIALLVAGIQEGDEVILPALTFVATANAIHHAGAVPHFVDCDQDSLGIDPEALERHLADIATMQGGRCVNRHTGRPIAALIPVHVFGHPARMGELSSIACRYDLKLIEDATEALGSRDGDQPVGRHGVISVLSFNGNKIVTTGGGGVLLTDDRALADRARHLTTTAKQPHRWAFIHDEIGYNYRLPNINAALGYAQLERLDEFVARKRFLAQAYRAAFESVPGIQFHMERPGTASNYWLQAILLDEGLEHLRDPLLNALNDAGLQSRPVWTPMHQLSFHQNCPRSPLDVTESISARLINIPSSSRLLNIPPK